MAEVTSAVSRLEQEYRHLRRDLPPGFFAKPLPRRQGTIVQMNEPDYFRWICGIPGKENTIWEGCTLRAYIFFGTEFPYSAPKIQFDPPLFHPNVYPSGTVCLSILTTGWKPTFTVSEILLSIQRLLDDPNLDSPAQREASNLRRENLEEYNRRVRQVVEQNKTEDFQVSIKRLVQSGEFRTTARSPPEQILEID
ncbi:Ubiquitin-conjugating enzyme [Giardia muris]|uniref:Ubiquitin-conjugating enzyme n=1 Tax=Giardia muris TaxID=5742 RepID=A0A4Z1SVB7_GIAMU|nr:Ubiquitin-conjugating enzyme [Giardia muris]|eukprot:TNJ29746.1 Ubiquitin-conjugating enzyme [Giardia muris]